MTAVTGPDRFSTLPLDLQKSITRFLSYGDTKDARVSQLFKKLMDDPFLWKALGDRMNFKINLKTAKEDFMWQYEAPDLIFNKMSNDEKEAIKKLPFPEQRAALKKMIASEDTNGKLHRLIFEALARRGEKLENNQWRAASFVLRNSFSFDTAYMRDTIFEASKDHLDIFKAYLECKNNKSESLSDLYLDHMRIMHFTHVGCVPTLLEMGVVPNSSHLARAIVEIACDKADEPEKWLHSAQERLQPILDYFKDDQHTVKEAMELADQLVAELKKKDELYLTATHRMKEEVFEKSQEAKESLAKQVQSFLDANFNKKRNL